MPPLKLQRQELFCQNLIQGMTQTDAAVKAGYSLKTCAKNTEKLRKNKKIIARLAELNTKIESRAIITVQQRKELLTQFATETIESKYGIMRDSNIRAIAELNKIDGDYAPEKINLDARVAVASFVFLMPDGSTRTAREMSL